MGTYVWQRRGRFALVAVGIIAVLLVVVGVRLIGSALATSGGNAYSVPDVVDTNPSPTIVETTIIAEEAEVDLGNGMIAHNAQTYNGQIPGPAFRLHVGDTVIVHFENHLPDQATGIHWHGIELANASDGTPLTQNQVNPDGKFLYKFKVSRPGIYWYHPHHETSMNQVFRGMYGPIIITDPNEAQLIGDGTIPGADDTRTLSLSDVTVCKAEGENTDQATSQCESPIDVDGNALPAGTVVPEGNIPYIQKAGLSGTVREGLTVLTNGRNVGGRAGTPEAPGALDAGAELLDVRPGQGLRLQLGDAATTRFFRLRLTGTVGGVDGTQIPLIRIGGQGGLLDDAVQEGGVVAGFDFQYDAGEILLDPGDRQDVVVAIPDNASGVLTLWTKDLPRTGAGDSGIPTVPVAHFNVTGTPVSPAFTIGAGTGLRSATGDTVPALVGPFASLLDPASFAPPKTGCTAAVPCPIPDIHLTNIQLGPVGNRLGINGVIGSHTSPTGDYKDIPFLNSTRFGKLGDTLELLVTNETGAHHPFHLHGFSIQPISLTDTLPGDPPLGDPDKSPGTGAPYLFPYHEFRDNIDVPAGYTLTYRIKLEDRALMDGVTPGGGMGKWLFHCHIFFHHHFGMVSELVVVDAAGNERPYINADGASVEVDEGSLAAMTGTYADPDGDGVTLSGPALAAATDNLNGTWDWSYTTTDGPDESQILYVTADDGSHKDQAAFQLTVNNVPPTVTLVTPPTPLTGALYALGSANIEVQATITDPGTADTLSCNFNWDDGTPNTNNAPISGVCDALHSFTQAGVYTVVLTGSDDDGGSDAESILIVVYDPTAGFVTGGGTIDSPAGAYVADPSLAGKAIFGFESKYKKGATTPIGHTEFKFHVADFDFESDSYEWLVVAGARAQYKGVGTVNGAGNFGFLLTATDGQLSGGGGFDKFRIKIVDKSASDAVVYDNVLGGSDDMDVANPQLIAGGSIVIHKPK